MQRRMRGWRRPAQSRGCIAKLNLMVQAMKVEEIACSLMQVGLAEPLSCWQAAAIVRIAIMGYAKRSRAKGRN